jgi:hypothetical protein
MVRTWTVSDQSGGSVVTPKPIDDRALRDWARHRGRFDESRS